jgi:hypothetical protein
VKLKIIAGLSGVALAFAVTGAFACGESLFRVGKGVDFRQYTTPLPGNILAVANGEAELLMMEQLAAAGHDVHVVADPAQIHDELGEHDFDIVLAWYSQRDEVASQIVGSGATFIPVGINDTDAARSMQREYEYALLSDDNVKTFLKSIHQTLKARG